MLPIRAFAVVVFFAILAWLFISYDGWLELCAGLAIFIFGMECLEAGLKKLTGTSFEKLLTKSTSTPFRGLLFGIGSTAILQSSTLVSLLTIAFISSGLIQLAGGIAIIFGANLGATTGIWLLAAAGKGFSLSPFALPILVFGMLIGFVGDKGKGIGRLLLGIGFIFLGIDSIKIGFSSLGNETDFIPTNNGGLASTLLFVLLGIISSVVLQSSHATLMLVLTALAGGQLQFDQSLAIVIGSNVGSSVSTAAMGILGGNRSGQRLAVAHVIFNFFTALAALIFLSPLVKTVILISGYIGFSDNQLLQLALFHTLFNVGGVLIFWPWQNSLVRILVAFLPDKVDVTQTPHVIISKESEVNPLRALYLTNQALESIDAASAAISLELRRLGHLTLSVISKTIYVSENQLSEELTDKNELGVNKDNLNYVADELYQVMIKGVYSDLLDFMGKMNFKMDDEHQAFINRAHTISMKLVEGVKSAKHLQKNLSKALLNGDSAAKDLYLDIRFHLYEEISMLHSIDDNDSLETMLIKLDRSNSSFSIEFRKKLFSLIRENKINGSQASSLMNDIGYTEQISQCMRDILSHIEEPQSLKQLRDIA